MPGHRSATGSCPSGPAILEGPPFRRIARRLKGEPIDGNLWAGIVDGCGGQVDLHDTKRAFTVTESSQPVPPLPVLRSLFTVEGLAELIASRYELTDVTCQLIKGTIRDTYKVVSGDASFVFSIHRSRARAPNEIRAELSLLDHLAAGNVPVAPAVKCLGGDWLVPIAAPEGQRYGVLYRYVPGQHLVRQSGPDITCQLGQAIAQLHVRADRLPMHLDRPVLDLQTEMETSLTTLAEVVPQRAEDFASIRELAGGMQPEIAALPRTSPGFGIIHGDVIPSNVQVSPEGNLTLLDFDFCGYGWRAYDVATFLGEMRFWQAQVGNREAFIAGYEAVRPLVEWEKALPTLEAVRHIASLGTPAQYVNEWGAAYLTDSLIDNLIACIQQASNDIHDW